MSAPVIPLRTEPCEIFDLHAHMLKRERIGDRDLQRSHELAVVEIAIDEIEAQINRLGMKLYQLHKKHKALVEVQELERLMDRVKDARSCKA